MTESSISVGGIGFCQIFPGEFVMGESAVSKQAPLMKARLSTPFLMGETPVTRAQWRAHMGSEPWAMHGDDALVGPVEDAQWPATWVTYDATLAFCAALTQVVGSACLLPSEVEWEYAYRAGTRTKWFWGDDLHAARAFSVFTTSRERGVLGPVRSRQPNPWGLFDMAGLVYEWVRGEYEQDTETPYVKPGTYPEVSDDFIAQGSGVGRMIRGGSYLSGPGGGTAYTKALRSLDACYKDIGFRVCLRGGRNACRG